MSKKFRSLQEYENYYYKKLPKRKKGDKYYELGRKIARKAIERTEHEKLKNKDDRFELF